VILAVNMQTSFMHPPFGFALFYLRSVAPREVKTTDIYWGAIPFVVIQLVMVTLVMLFPQMVMIYKADAQTQEQPRMEIQLPPAESGTADEQRSRQNEDASDIERALRQKR
jgi:hypothetical protein